MTKVFLTGANGFVGQTVCKVLCQNGYDVIAGTRDGIPVPGANRTLALGDLTSMKNHEQWFQGVDAVVHLAARAHVMKEHLVEPLEAFRATNVYVTRRLAQAALQEGVRRFVLLSSVKVNGEHTLDEPFNEKTPPNPIDPYGQSKAEAEQVLHETAFNSRLETVVLRAPLIYGPHVRANFLSLIKLCDSGWPLPLAGIKNNGRSMIFVENLPDAICQTLDHSAAATKTYLVSDGQPVATFTLVKKIRALLDRPKRLVWVPPGVFRSICNSIGKSAVAARLTRSLVVDDSLIRKELGWCTPHSWEKAMKETVTWYQRLQ